MRRQLSLRAITSCICIAICSNVFAQVAPLNQKIVQVKINSGILQSDPDLRKVIFEKSIVVPNATWLRLEFDRADLGVAPNGGQPTILKITSLTDGATQHHVSQTLKQWENTSAYFNGNEVRLEVIADPKAAASHIIISSVFAGVDGGGGPLETICGITDDRLPSDDARVGRALPIGCTAWLINDSNNCLITAGHCSDGALSVIEFNVPLSGGGGAIQHPGPEDQYAVDLSSKQFVNGGQGNDWGYFGCFDNTETGLPAGVVQGDVFELAEGPPSNNGQNIRITGHGVDNSPPEWNQIQQTSVGPYLGVTQGLNYETDTTGGNSGSPVIHEETGLAIGVHTHGGCTANGGQNHGTPIDNSGFQAALNNPQGVCIPAPPIAFTFPNGLPELINPAGDSIRVIVSGQNGGDPEPGTGQLHVNTGGGFITIHMKEILPNEYDAVFGKTVCTSVIEYYFSAEDSEGVEYSNPLFAPEMVYSALSATGLNVAFEDDFEENLGWISSGNAADGMWDRGVPIDCLRGDPPADADGSGQCYLTDNSAADACNSDVDNGSTTLTSPMLDASAEGSVISYWRWYSNSFGDSPMQDIFTVQVSSNNGASWVDLEIVGPGGPEVNGGWFRKDFTVSDFVEPTDQFRIRFTASDTDPQSVVEAGIDLVRMIQIICDPDNPSDLNGDGVVNTTDLLILFSNWGPCADCEDCPADLDNDCIVNTSDLLVLFSNWG